MFALLSGSEVHSGRTANEVLIAAATTPAPLLASVLPGVSPAVTRCVDKALAFERELRWRDAMKMQEAVRSAYHDRYGTPLSTAPRLTVPPTVVNRTLASATVAPVSPATPTTNGAVAVTRVGASLPRALVSLAARFRRPSLIALGVGGAVVAVAIGLSAALVSSGSKAPASSAAEGTTMVPANPEPRAVSNSQASAPPPPAAPEPTTVPVVAPTDLPMDTAPAVETTKSTQKPVSGSASATPTTAKTTKPGCSPPYVLDPATGTKKWKAECF